MVLSFVLNPQCIAPEAVTLQVSSHWGATGLKLHQQIVFASWLTKASLRNAFCFPLTFKFFWRNPAAMSWCSNFSDISLLQTGCPVWNLEKLMYRVILCTLVGHCPENIAHFAINRAKPFTLCCIKGKVTFLFCSWERTQSPRFFSFLDLTGCNKLDFFLM